MGSMTHDALRRYNYAGSDDGNIEDALDDLEAGDEILWGDRVQPLTVAHVAGRNDPAGQAFAASVIHDRIEESQEQRAQNDWNDAESADDFFLEGGDVFLNPDSWGTLCGKKFVLVQGPQGGFYAIAEPESNRTYPALFRAVRTYHSTKMGQPGQGAWDYEHDLDGELVVVGEGDAPDEIDPEGDLPTFDDIRDNRLVSYDRDAEEHYVVTETVEEAFDIGLREAHKRAAGGRDGDGDDDGAEAGSPWDAVPDAERVEGSPDGSSHGSVRVTEIVETTDGLRAVLDGPAPWDTPDWETPINEAIKETSWDDVEYKFDDEREAWTINASELVAVASTLRFHGFHVVDEAERED